jgi:hypothetical protein
LKNVSAGRLYLKIWTSIQKPKSILIKEIITAKLFYYQAFFSMLKLEQEQLVTLLSEIIVEKNNIKNPYAKGQN